MTELKISYEELVSTLENILQGIGFSDKRAKLCAELFAKASVDGVASHGVNRFPLFLEMIRKGFVNVTAEPVLNHSSGFLERWDGQLGPGNLNAHHCMAQAIKLARDQGIGCVAINNTNHWMRGGNYGWQAVEKGCIGICITNTKPNMPAWGGSEPVLGNNPLVIAVPRKKGPLVLDMALGQFSYGKMEDFIRTQALLPYNAGFDDSGNLTKDPATILANELALPVGLWKGAGLALILDVLVSILSEGNATHQIGAFEEEYAISQIFFALYLQKMGIPEYPEEQIDEIIESLKSSSVFGSSTIRYPGEQTLKTRQYHTKNGIPVDKKIWEKTLSNRK